MKIKDKTTILPTLNYFMFRKQIADKITYHKMLCAPSFIIFFLLGLTTTHTRTHDPRIPKHTNSIPWGPPQAKHPLTNSLATSYMPVATTDHQKVIRKFEIEKEKKKNCGSYNAHVVVLKLIFLPSSIYTGRIYILLRTHKLSSINGGDKYYILYK